MTSPTTPSTGTSSPTTSSPGTAASVPAPVPAPVTAPSDSVGVDVRIVRGSALLTFLVTLLAGVALLTGQPTAAVILLAAQVIAFSLGIWRLPAQPWSRLARLTGLYRVFPAGPAEHRLPVRFSQQVGLLCVAPALIATVVGWVPVAVVFTLACAGAAALNAFANLCLACRIYPAWRLVLARVGLG